MYWHFLMLCSGGACKFSYNLISFWNCWRVDALYSQLYHIFQHRKWMLFQLWSFLDLWSRRNAYATRLVTLYLVFKRFKFVTTEKILPPERPPQDYHSLGLLSKTKKKVEDHHRITIVSVYYPKLRRNSCKLRFKQNSSIIRRSSCNLRFKQNSSITSFRLK